MSGVNLRVRMAPVTDISSVDRGEIFVTSDSVVRVNTTLHVVTNISAIPSLIGYLGTQGDTGIEGNAADTGPQGSTGCIGDTGLQGDRGAQGYDAIEGYYGARGSTGSQGCTGAQGFAGLHGSKRGDGGVTGATGCQGSADTGQQGATGVTGFGPDTGNQGFAGVQGDMGDQGGYTGMQGATGCQGSGPTGDTGLQGDTGLTGAQGDGYIGSVGEQGVQGSTGSQGAKGWTGLKGATGTRAHTGATGSQGLAGRTGVRGTQGATGLTGATGARGKGGTPGTRGLTGGSTGPTGSKGYEPQGLRGWTGDEGSTGLDGATGYTGSEPTGAQGETGETGPDGVQGSTGDMGATGDGAQGDTGFTGVEGDTGSDGVQGYTGSQGFTGDTGDSSADTGPDGITGFKGSQGYRGSQGNQGTTGRADTGAQGLRGKESLVQGSRGAIGPTGAQGINRGYTASPLVNQRTQLIGFDGALFRHNSNMSTTSTLLTVPNLSTDTLTADTVHTQVPSVTPITYITSSNAGSNTVFIIQNVKNCYPITLSTPHLFAYFPGNTFTQVVTHPSGWFYLYSDSNALYSTPSNYIFSLSPDGNTLSNLSFTSPIYHMAVDPLGNVFVSSSNITRYTVNPSTGELASDVSIDSPFPEARMYVTAGYVYAYLRGDTSNVFRYPIGLSNQLDFSCYSGTLSSFSADPLDKILYSTTTTSNIYTYTVSTGVTTQLTSNLSSVASTPIVDSYTNTLVYSLPSSTSVQVTGLDGTFSYEKYTSFQDFPYTPTGIVSNPITSTLYACVGNYIQAITSNAVYTLVGSSNSGNADGSNAQFNSPQAVCLDTTGSNLYVADTGNSSVRKIALTTVPGLQLWLDGADPSGNGVVPSDGTSIATWIDKSGNGYNATAAGTNTYVTSSLNGLPGIQFSSNQSTDYFSSTIPPSTFQSGISMFIVFQASDSNDPQYCSPIARVGLTGGVDIQGSNVTVLNSPPTTDTVTYTTSLLPSSLVSPVIYSVSISPLLFGTLCNGVSYPVTSSTSGPSGGEYNVATFDSTSSTIYIGTDGSNGYLNGIVYEVIVYTTLSTEQRQKIEGYLAHKWGLLLQCSHPYYAINPIVSPLFMQSATVSTLVTGLSNPQGIACDSTNLYIADTGNHVIKRYTLETSVMSNIGSNGVSGSTNGVGSVARFNYPKGLTLSSDYSLLYIADSSNYTVRALSTSNLSTSVYMGLTGVKGFTSSNLSAPTALTVNSNGVLYVTDTGNNAIVYANALGIVYFSSNSIAGISSLYSIASSPLTPNTIYGCDQNTSKIFSYDLITGTLTTLYTIQNYIISIAVDSSLNTYVTTAGGTNSILRNGLAIPGTRNIGNYGAIVCIDSTDTYAYVYTFAQIYKISLPNGPAVLLAGSPTSAYGYADGIGSNALFFQPGGLCVDTAGSNLYICDTNNDVIRKINLRTSNVTTVVGVYGGYWTTAPIDGVGSNVRLRYFTGITSGKSGLLYFIDSDAGLYNTTYIRTLDPVSLRVKTLHTIPGGNAYNYTIYINPTETTIYLPAESGISQNTLGYYAAVLAGSNVGYSNAVGTHARFNTPLGITFNDSNLIVIDSSNQMLRTVNPSSNVTSYNLSMDYQFTYMQTLSASSNSFYTMGNVTIDSTTYSALITIPIATYAPTTFTFSNLGSTTHIQNATGRAVTISVAGETVTNPVLPSAPNASYIATLFTTGSGYSLI